jgi:23S rRNA pseudouridine2605 synthase
VTRARPPASTEKLHKVLARAGLGSRREIETWIAAGRVSVDGIKATLGSRVTGAETIRIDGRVVPRRRLEARRRVLLYHKPDGEICSRSDPQGRPTVFDHLPRIRGGRWVVVGRLDFTTTGLLLLTTDGELAQRLTHPSFEVEREYAVRVLGEVAEQTLQQLRAGVELEDGPARFDNLVDAGGEGANHWYRVTLKEGRNREVRRLWESQGVQVSRLIRVRFGPVVLPRHLPRGRWMEMEPQALQALERFAGLKPTRPDALRPGRRPARAERRRQAPPRRPRKPAPTAG